MLFIPLCDVKRRTLCLGAIPPARNALIMYGCGYFPFFPLNTLFCERGRRPGRTTGGHDWEVKVVLLETSCMSLLESQRALAMVQAVPKDREIRRGTEAKWRVHRN